MEINSRGGFRTNPYNIRFEDVFKLYLRERHIPILEKLLDFKITRHLKYNLKEEALELFSKFINYISQEGIKILEGKRK